jgi:hypothetical protein
MVREREPKPRKKVPQGVKYSGSSTDKNRTLKIWNGSREILQKRQMQRLLIVYRKRRYPSKMLYGLLELSKEKGGCLTIAKLTSKMRQLIAVLMDLGRSRSPGGVHWTRLIK